MLKKTSKKILMTAVLTCCITMLWACAAMAEHTRITNATEYKATGEVKYKKNPLCKKSGFSYTVDKGGISDQGRHSKCEVMSIGATLHDGSNNTPCKGINETTRHENFRIQGDMNKCEVVKSQQ